MAQFELKLLNDQLQHNWKYQDLELRFIPVETQSFMKAVPATKAKKAPAPEAPGDG